MHKTSRDYWDSVWNGDHASQALNPASSAVLNHYDRAIHQALLGALHSGTEPPRTLLELGCGGSLFLPYFARWHQLQVCGLDYSPSGCQSARQQLHNHGQPGEVVEGDIFNPPPSLLERFDVVFSMGVFEHFTDTTAIVRAASRFVRSGGMMITIIPNMKGIPGWLQKNLHPALFDMHVPLDCQELAAAHRNAGLTILQSRYLMTCNPYVVQSRNPRSLGGKLYRVSRGMAARLLWGAEQMSGRSWPNRLTSPYVLCVARRPEAGHGIMADASGE